MSASRARRVRIRAQATQGNLHRLHVLQGVARGAVLAPRGQRLAQVLVNERQLCRKGRASAHREVRSAPGPPNAVVYRRPRAWPGASAGPRDRRTWARKVGATRSPSRMPSRAISSACSRSSFAAETAWASCSARSVSFSAALKAEEIERTFRMREVVISPASHGLLIGGQTVSLLGVAQGQARRAVSQGSATPRESRYPCTCSSEGTGNCTGRHRERIVTSTSVGGGAVSSQMVCGAAPRWP